MPLDEELRGRAEPAKLAYIVKASYSLNEVDLPPSTQLGDDPCVNLGQGDVAYRRRYELENVWSSTARESLYGITSDD